MAWLHAWAGWPAGWILYAVFISGTLSYFRPEISHWMRPELVTAREQPDSVAMAMRILQERAPNSSRWVINLPNAREPTLRVGWMAAAEPGKADRLIGRFDGVVLDPSTGKELQPRQTRGGDFFQRFHYELGLGQVWGRWLVGGCAMAMLIAILSGVIAHKQLFRNFFTFRPGKGQRSWLDAHHAVGVLALPYHLLIAYTGLITMMFMYMPAAVETAYRYDPGGFLVEAFPNPPHAQPTGRSARLTTIEPVLQQAERQWNGATPASIVIEYPGDAGARIQMQRTAHGKLTHTGQFLIFDGVSGELLSIWGEESGAMQAHGVLYGLHMARFSSASLRWIFALCGVLGTVMVATGLVLWAVKRAPQRAEGERTPLSQRFVEVLNTGTITGLPIAVAVYFWANRLLPVTLADRPIWEIRCFFTAWGLTYIAALLQNARMAWPRHFFVGTLLFALLPLLNGLTTPAHLGITLTQGPAIYAGFDLSMLAIAALLGSAAWNTSRKRPESKQATGNALPAAAPMLEERS